jgi:8-oxo-dGTP pyrophosphatase MutT (NUDIX family)
MADEKEIRELAQRYGNPERASFRHVTITPGFREWVRRLTRRRGEVVLVVPRGRGQVLLHTKPHYPPEVYRLPTGGIRTDEAADAAARREAFEEVGWNPRTLELIGVLENTFLIEGNHIAYPSYVFQTEEYLAAPAPKDQEEIISGFRAVDSSGLRTLAHLLSGLPDGWHEWGRFRAASHRWLANRA